MKRTYLILPLLLACGVAAAKPTIRTEEDPAGRFTTFYLDGKDYPGTLTVYLTLNNLSNCKTAPGTTKFFVRTSGTRLVTLRADDEGRGLGYGYLWSYFNGPVDPPQVDTAFVYRMPCTTARPVEVLHGVSVLDVYRKPRGEQEKLGYCFPLEKGDTVYAMRRGVVTEIKRPDSPAAGDPAVSFTTHSMDITVEQPDGTHAWYICFDPDNVLVREGDEVLPGTPLGLAGSYDGEHYKISVQIYWLESPKQRGATAYETKRCFPRFATAEGVVVPEHGASYTPVMNDALLLRELSKRERRRLRGVSGGK